jgi:hypothetical protein
MNPILAFVASNSLRNSLALISPAPSLAATELGVLVVLLLMFVAIENVLFVAPSNEILAEPVTSPDREVVIVRAVTSAGALASDLPVPPLAAGSTPLVIKPAE